MAVSWVCLRLPETLHNQIAALLSKIPARMLTCPTMGTPPLVLLLLPMVTGREIIRSGGSNRPIDHQTNRWDALTQINHM